MESASTSQINRPPDGPWKWPLSWHVLRECPDAMDLINGQLLHWTNCAGVIADAFEEGGYPKLAKSVRGMQGGYRSEPMERWEIDNANTISVSENSVVKAFRNKMLLFMRESMQAEWRVGNIGVPSDRMKIGLMDSGKELLTLINNKGSSRFRVGKFCLVAFEEAMFFRQKRTFWGFEKMLR